MVGVPATVALAVLCAPELAALGFEARLDTARARRLDVRNGFSGVTVSYQIDADATAEEIQALVAQSQKRSAVYDIITNPTNVTVEVC